MTWFWEEFVLGGFAEGYLPGGSRLPVPIQQLLRGGRPASASAISGMITALG